MTNLVSQIEQALNELKLKEAQLKEDEERLKKEKEWIANNQLKTEKKIKLNVGGTYFTTTLTTLNSDPNSMLAAMFSGRFPIEKDEDDGAYFIDRDGRLFGIILNWLRARELPQNVSLEDLVMLKKEAEYYQLGEEFKAALQQCINALQFDCVAPDYAKWRLLGGTQKTHHTTFIPASALGSSKSQPQDHSEDKWFEQEVVARLKQGYRPLTLFNRTVLVRNMH